MAYRFNVKGFYRIGILYLFIKYSKMETIPSLEIPTLIDIMNLKETAEASQMTDQELQKQQQELQKQRDHEADLQRLRGFRPIDDTFMRCIYQDNIPLAEMTLRIITGINDLVLTKGETQKDFKRLLGARSICLDYHGVDKEGRQYDLEVQKADSGARPERARYHSAAMDIEALNANQLFEELPETYTIFVTENDIYGFGDGIYPIERVIVTHEQLFNDRAHILYVNGAYRGNDPLGDLMHDFCCNDPDDMKNAMLAEASRYYKENPKGVEIMCKVIEEMREEVEERTMLNAIKNIMEGLKYTAQQAMELLKIPADDQPKYLAKL